VANISFPVFDDRGAPLAALTVPSIEYASPSLSLADVIEKTRRG
jgi:DNA-binding IclR family transcriptional regulator